MGEMVDITWVSEQEQTGKHGRWHGEGGEVIVHGLCMLACHVTWSKSRDTTRWASPGTHGGTGGMRGGMGICDGWTHEVGERLQTGEGRASRWMAREQCRVGEM